MDAILNTLSDKGGALRTPSGTGLPLVAGSRQARERKDGLRHVDGIRLIYDDTPSNMVYMRPIGMSPADFIARLRERGVLCGGQEDWVRMVTHYGINAEDIDEALEAIASAVKLSVAAG